jgi:hypothetical protein
VAVKVTSNATFTAAANGIPAPGYQWLFSGTNIPGATASSYTRTNVQYAHAGNYRALATNGAGVSTTSNALLSIITAAPGQFQSVTWLPDASIELVLAGDPGATYFVQSSTNLLNWSPLTNITLSSGTFSFNIAGLTNGPQQFFRARSGP